MAEASSASYEAMSKEHRQILRNNRPFLENDLEALHLLRYLSNVLSEEDEEDIKAEQTRFAQARKLLDILPRRGHNAFNCFIGALRNIQPHIAYYLSEKAGLEDPSSCSENSLHIMSQECKDRLRCSRKRLTSIDITDQVLPLMRVVLTDMDIQLINSKPTNLEKWDEFISVLQRKGSKAFEHFVSVLEIRGYSDVVKYLKGEASDKEYQVDGLKWPIQVVALDKPHTEDIPIIKIMNKMEPFFRVTNENNQWKSLVREFQLQEGGYDQSTNPTCDVIEDWSTKDGNNATTGVLSKTLEKLNLLASKECLKKIELDFFTSNSTINALVKETGNLTIGSEHTDGAPSMIRDLNRNICQQLLKVVQAEISSKPNCSVSFSAVQNINLYAIRDFTKLLRDNRLTDTIKWMKENLPAGVTGPLLDEMTNVRDMPYKVRSLLTIELTVDKNWKKLGGELGLEATTMEYFDQRFTNPADEVLKNWHTKRNSTIGALYDMLVKLDMSVIADKAL